MSDKSISVTISRVLKVPPAVILVFALILAGVAAYSTYRHSLSRRQAEIDELVLSMMSAIDMRLRIYESALLHARSFMQAEGSFDRAKFRHYVETLELRRKYPGVLGIGFVPRIPSRELKAHIQRVRAEGFKTYHVWPETPREEYFSILFLEPFDARNRRAFGYDMFTDPKRRVAMNAARDSGHAAMSGRVVLVQESGESPQYGFLLYVPMYDERLPLATVEQRRQALTGFIYSPFRAGDLFDEIMAEENRKGRAAVFEVFDGQELDAESLLFTPFSEPVSLRPDAEHRIVKQTFFGRDWTIAVTPIKESLTPMPIVHWVVLLIGSFLSFLIYAFSRVASSSAFSLHKSETQMRLVADALPALVAYVNPEHRYTFNNLAFSHWFGIDHRVLVGQQVASVFSEEIYRAHLKPCLARALAGESVATEFTLDVGGRSRFVQAEYIPDARDGRVAGVVVLMSDRTLQRHDQERLRDERRISEQLVEVGLSLRAEMDIGTLTQKITDIGTELSGAQFGAFFYNNRSSSGEGYLLYSISGVPKEAFAKFPMPRSTALFGPTSRGERIVRYDDVTLAPEFGKNTPYAGMPSGHLPVHSYLAVPVISQNGNVLGGLFFGHRDVGVFTERSEKLMAGLAAQAAVALDNSRLLSESQAVSRVKDEFLATLSHELRTPLNVILGYSELLEEAELPSELHKYVQTIHRNARTQSQLIADLLDISAIITGKLAFDPVKTKIAEVVHAAVDSVRFAAESKGVNLVVDLKPEGCPIVGDPTRLQQIVWNLLSNALKFTPKGGEVRVSAWPEQSRCVLQVSDTGSGIEPEFLPYVFDRFRQEDSSRSRRFGGLGLGLAIVRHLVELHGGSIRADSAGKNRGAVFTVRFPIQPVAQDDVTSRRDGAKPDGGRRDDRPLRVLVVDDEADARGLLEQMLAREGMRVDLAASAQEAFLKYRQHRPDVIVSDIGMPEEDGLSLIRRLRQLEQEHGEFTPAIALTAYARDEERNRALSAGYQVHLPKPVERANLLQAIDGLVS